MNPTEIEFNTPQSICRFGIARCDITPPVGMYHRMWGAAAHDRSAGIHRPLTATAMVFRPTEEDDDLQVVVAIDHCLFWSPQMEQFVSRVSSAAGIKPEQLLIAFSHTHAAGLVDPQRSELPGGDMIVPYLDDMTNKVAGAVQEALASTQMTTIAYVAGRCSLAAHRDFWDEKNGLFVCGFNPAVKADDTVMLARVTAEDGQTLATIVNYACHPTTLAWDNQLVSPDYPGAMRETVEQATGAPCVFLQGASGDLGPREGFVGDVEVADRNGRQLGYAALSALDATPPPKTKHVYVGPVVSGATIGTWKHVPLSTDPLQATSHWQISRTTIDLAYRTDIQTAEETQQQFEHWQREEQAARDAGDEEKATDARAMVERNRRWLTRYAALPPGDHFPFPVTLWRMGDAVWLAVEGEPYNLLQRQLRQRFPQTPIVVMVLANGSRAWYLPTKETYGKGIYQESMANLAQGSLEKLIDEVGNMIAEVQRG